MKTQLLFLDDNPARHRDYKARGGHGRMVKTVEECLAALSEQGWDVVFLDHDLDGREYVDPREDGHGGEVAREMARWPWPHPKPTVVLHSHHPTGGEYMAEYLGEAGFIVVRARFRTKAFWAVLDAVLAGGGWKS